MIVSYAKSESTLGGLPFPSLIHEILSVQKDRLAESDDLDMPRKPLSISTKVYTGAHVQDVGNEDADIDPDNLVTDSVPTSSSAAPLKIMDLMTSKLTKVRQRRVEIVKQIQQLQTESIQLSAKEACIKTFMETYEEPMPPSSSSDEDDSD